MTAAVELPLELPNDEDAVRPRPRHGSAATLGQCSEAPRRLRILVVDPDQRAREACANVLRRDGYEVVTCGDADHALAQVAVSRADLLVAADSATSETGVSLVHAYLGTRPGAQAIVMADHPSVADSIAMAQQGAIAYLPKPFAASHLQLLAGRAAHTLGLCGGEGNETSSASESIENEIPTPLGRSPALMRVLELARKVAGTTAPVFITGESGSGKEMIAQLIHAWSRRSHQPFVPVNCAAFPDNLLETEMFGHRKGAFTDAVRDKPGLLEAAHQGTLFLDELLEMEPALQAKLLRATEDGVVRRVGSEKTDAVVDVRFIVATNRDPEAALASGRLREDLYYRLRVVPIHVPPLRERREDIALLAEHFLERSWLRHRTAEGPPPYLSDAAIHVLLAHQWSGNVRELQNVIEHAVVLATPGRRISAADLPLTPSLTLSKEEKRDQLADGAGAARPETLRLPSYHALRDQAIALFQRRYVAALLRQAGGNMAGAARIAAVPRSTLYRMMERQGRREQPCPPRAEAERRGRARSVVPARPRFDRRPDGADYDALWNVPDDAEALVCEPVSTR